jgi:hypothetical protein
MNALILWLTLFCKLPNGTVIEVLCPAVPEIGARAAWVLVVVEGEEMHVKGNRLNGFMPRLWLWHMPWRFPAGGST